MHIIYPVHAKERMEERDIKEEQIKEAICYPHVNLSTKNKRRKRVMKKFGSKTLDVIYEARDGEKIVIVTAVWLKNEDRKVKE